jgi:ribosomal protein L24E
MRKRLRRLALGISAVAMLLGATTVSPLIPSGSAGAAGSNTLFTGRDIYSPDVIANPNGQGYLMWYGGWQTQQALNAGQLDTIFERTAPTPNGPWSNPITNIVPTQVAFGITEVNDPSVSVSSIGGSYLFTMFFTGLSCGVGCATQLWSATSGDGTHWGSFKQLMFTDAYGLDASSPSVVLQPSGAQRWLVYYGADCIIAVASVDANRNVLSSNPAYRGNSGQCMANPDVIQSGNQWYMYFNVIETLFTDVTRFNIWQTSSPSPTSWTAPSTPVLQVDGVQRCSALTPFVLPISNNQINLYYGVVAPTSSNQCTDLTNSTSVVADADPPPPGFSFYGAAQTCSPLAPGSVTGMAGGPNDGGYWIANTGGQVDGCGFVSTGYGALSSPPASPIVGMAATPDGHGYWLVGQDGSIYAFGDAGYYGSLPAGGVTPSHPIVGIASSPDGRGYFMVASDGGIFACGDAQFHGSTGSLALNAPIVGMTVDRHTGGYWLVAADGGIFAFDAPFQGSMGGSPLNLPVVGMAADPVNNGYWLVAADGGIFSFGGAPFEGSTGALRLNQPIVGMEASPAGNGYRFVANDGGIFSFGSSQFFGSAA